MQPHMEMPWNCTSFSYSSEVVETNQICSEERENNDSKQRIEQHVSIRRSEEFGQNVILLEAPIAHGNLILRRPGIAC